MIATAKKIIQRVHKLRLFSFSAHSLNVHFIFQLMTGLEPETSALPMRCTLFLSFEA